LTLSGQFGDSRTCRCCGQRRYDRLMVQEIRLPGMARPTTRNVQATDRRLTSADQRAGRASVHFNFYPNTNNRVPWLGNDKPRGRHSLDNSHLAASNGGQEAEARDHVRPGLQPGPSGRRKKGPAFEPAGPEAEVLFPGQGRVNQEWRPR
jgi:hypothetical protein